MPCLRKSSFSKILNFKKAIRQLSQSENRTTPTTKTIPNNLIGSDSDLALLVEGHHRPISNAATSTPITNSRSDLIGRRSIDSSSTRVSEQSSATSSPLSMARSNLKKSTSRQRSFRGSEKRRLLESLESICELCNEVLQNKPKNDPVYNFKASCTSLAEQISENRIIEAKSIEDLTNSLALFGNDKIKVNQSILGELDQLIGDFLELSGQQYVVSTTLTVQDHSVLVEETESLENVTNRTGFDPYFLQKPLPAESNGEDSFQLSAKVCGIPRPYVKWYKSKMSLNNSTRMVDVLGDYCIVADNVHGSAQCITNVKYKIKPDSNNSYFNNDRSNIQSRFDFVDDGETTDTDRSETTIKELHIDSSDDDSQSTQVQMKL